MGYVVLPIPGLKIIWLTGTNLTYNGAKSKLKVINCGVPQGSILGPLLFLIYINDLVSVCKSTMSIMFADDTSLFASGTDIHVIEDTINKELSNISTWLKVNRLSLNVIKTHFMMFTNKRYSIAKIEIKIDNEPIFQFLGVIIDNKLTWKEHIMYISGKISRGMGIIIKSRKFIYKQTLLNLYYSFIYPYFIYCNQVWGNTYKTYLQKLTLLQKIIIKIIAGVHPLTHTGPLFMQFNILKFANIHSFLIGRLMYRVFHGTLELFQGYFLVNNDVHNYLTRQTDHYHLPLFHTDLRKSSLRYYGAVLWNNIILSEVPYECSEYVFCKKLKHRLCLVKYRTHLSAGLFFWLDFDGHAYIHYDGNYYFWYLVILQPAAPFVLNKSDDFRVTDQGPIDSDEFLAPFVAVHVHYRNILIKSLSSYHDALNKLLDLFHACTYCMYMYMCCYSCNKDIFDLIWCH